MVALLNSLSSASLKRNVTAWSPGWVGIDIGCQLLKLAQVERRDNDWRIAKRWTLSPAAVLTSSSLASDGLGSCAAELRAARRVFRGRSAAAALSSSVIDLRAFDLPNGPWHETGAILQQELLADASDGQVDFQFDAWQAIDGGDTTKLMVASAPTSVASRIATDLTKAGLECSVLDAIPCALARAIAMCGAEAADGTTAAIDIGCTTSLATIVHEGRPVYCRTLRGCSLADLTQPLREKLNLDTAECEQFLSHVGVSDEADSSIAASAFHVMSGGLEHLAEEVRRTLGYASQQLRLRPTCTYLFGGGAMIRKIDCFLQHQTELPTTPWRLGGTAGNAQDPLFGVAAGLSALAWEKNACM